MKRLFAAILLTMSFPAIASYNPASVTSIGTPAQYQVQPGASDVTTQFQVMVTAATASVGSVYLPCGTYNISSAITIPGSNVLGFRIHGEAEGCVVIKQLTNATPIFKLTQTALSAAFRFDDFTATWANQQTSSVDSGHASVIVECSVTSGGSCFNFEMDHVYGENGSRMLSSDTGTNMWGVNFHDNYRESSMTGAIVFIAQTSGEPRYTIRNNYARVDGSAQNETFYNIYGVAQLIAENNEFNGATVTPYNSSNIQLFSIGQSSGTIDGLNVEQLYTSVGGEFIEFTNGTTGDYHLSLSHISISDHVTDSTPVFGVSIFAANTGAPPASSIDINGLGVNSYAGSSGSIFPYTANASAEIASVRGIYATSNGAQFLNGNHYNPLSANGGSYSGAFPEYDYDIQPSNCTNTWGNVSATITMRANGTGSVACRVNEYVNTLSANRTFTLPSTNFDDGTVFEIIRNAATPGAFTLQVIDPVSGNNCTFPNSTNGSVIYRATGWATWIPISKNGCS